VRPLAIDLFCGLGGWTEGLLAEDYDVVGFDIEQHVYGEHRYPAQLVVQDVLTLHGSQFKNATLIVASPPCQEYSYMAMPWTKAKAIAADYRSGKRDVKKLTALFDACFRIQREACEAAGRHIPLVVENVKGAQPWVGRSRWAFGSFHLWGDVPALMPIARRVAKVPGLNWSGFKNGDPNYRGQAFNPAAQGKALREQLAIKNTGGSWFNIAHNTTSGKGAEPGWAEKPQWQNLVWLLRRTEGARRNLRGPDARLQISTTQIRQRHDRQDPAAAQPPHRGDVQASHRPRNHDRHRLTHITQ
jgi:hypothetical protein